MYENVPVFFLWICGWQNAVNEGWRVRLGCSVIKNGEIVLEIRTLDIEVKRNAFHNRLRLPKALKNKEK